MLFLITDTTLLSQLRSLEVVVPRNLLVSLLYVLAFGDEQFQRVSLLAEVNHHLFSPETFPRESFETSLPQAIYIEKTNTQNKTKKNQNKHPQWSKSASV